VQWESGFKQGVRGVIHQFSQAVTSTGLCIGWADARNEPMLVSTVIIVSREKADVNLRGPFSVESA